MRKLDLNHYINLSSNCKIVIGAKRCLFINHFSGENELMPIEIYNIILKDGLNKPIKQILDNFSDNEKEKVIQYIKYLYKNQYIVFNDNKSVSNYYKKNADSLFQQPFHITNCVLILGANSDIKMFFLFAKSYIISSILIQVTHDIKMDELSKIIFSFNETTFSSVEIHLKNSRNIDVEQLKKMFNVELRLFKIVLFESTSSEITFEDQKLYNYIISVTEKLIIHNCGLIHPSLFSFSKKLYLESQNYNTCLNRKLTIDEDGDIKNCPSMKETFGNIKDITLEEILAKEDFKKYWKIKKDDIKVCKACEFRHVCTDCRAYLENPKDLYSKPLKCGYDPYTSKWEEWSTHPMKQKAINFYDIREILPKANA